MKKILLCVLLITQGFSVGFMDKLFMSDEEIAEAERIEAEQAKCTKHFFGIEGGAGWFDLRANFIIVTSMQSIFEQPIAPTLGYSVGISGGWQRYDYEKVGIRHTFGTRLDWGYDLGRFGGDEKDKYKNADGYSWTIFYYALDGLFDFVKSDENHRFGMTLGFSLGLNLSIIELPTKGKGGATLPFNGRLGFYTQFENNIIDLMASIPTFGCFGMGSGFADSISVTLGYKRLF